MRPTTEPHAHIQAGDSADYDRAEAVPITFAGSLPANRQIVDLKLGGGWECRRSGALGPTGTGWSGDRDAMPPEG